MKPGSDHAAAVRVQRKTISFALPTLTSFRGFD
jgi:hypothetical protein